ncbi:DUF5305 domain-containing protein [Candidatus Saccharibacteria bacterium]|nr:DUF5305 domain-containing protein [Candidatus Saccharibacteria bacterium]
MNPKTPISFKTTAAGILFAVFFVSLAGGFYFSRFGFSLPEETHALPGETHATTDALPAFAPATNRQDYTVCLFPNDFFDTTCQDPGRQYLTALTDKINFHFGYQLALDAPLTYHYHHTITAQLIVYDRDNRDKIIFSRDYLLQDAVRGARQDTSEIAINHSFALDFQPFNLAATAFKQHHDLHGDAVLIVQMPLELTVSHGDRSLTRPIPLEFTIPLAKQTYNIKVGKLPSSDDILAFAALESGLTQRLLLLGLLAALALAATSVLIFFFVQKRRSHPKNLCQRYDEKIHKEYGRLIVDLKTPLRSGDYKYRYFVQDFDDLIDKADRVMQNILYYRLPSGRTFYAVVEDDHLFLHGCPYAKQNRESKEVKHSTKRAK